MAATPLNKDMDEMTEKWRSGFAASQWTEGKYPAAVMLTRQIALHARGQAEDFEAHPALAAVFPKQSGMGGSTDKSH